MRKSSFTFPRPLTDTAVQARVDGKAKEDFRTPNASRNDTYAEHNAYNGTVLYQYQTCEPQRGRTKSIRHLTPLEGVGSFQAVTSETVGSRDMIINRPRVVILRFKNPVVR